MPSSLISFEPLNPPNQPLHASLLCSNQSNQPLNVPFQDVWKFTPVSYRTSAFGAAALLSLHFFTGSLPAGHWVPLTMCDPWMTSCVCLSVGWELRCKWGLDAPTHRSATILWPRVTCLIPFICSQSFISEVIFNQDCCLLEMNTPVPRWLNRYQWASSKDLGSPSTCSIRAYEHKHLGPTTARE